MIEVCAVVRETDIRCPILFPFEINITTHDLTAGIGSLLVKWKGYF